MFERVAILAALAGVSCTRGNGEATGFDGQPCSKYQLCVQNGNVFNCDCGGSSWPACAGTPQPETPCDYGVPSCMDCSQGAGATCRCEDAGLVPDQDGALWECIGTESACR